MAGSKTLSSKKRRGSFSGRSRKMKRQPRHELKCSKPEKEVIKRIKKVLFSQLRAFSSNLALQTCFRM